MKTTTVPAIVQIEANDLREFRAVNETLATDLIFLQPSENNKNFGVIDLWKCRKKRRMYGIKIR